MPPTEAPLDYSSRTIEQIKKSASRFQATMLIFLVVTIFGVAYALWLSTQLLQALRTAQFQAAGIIKNGDASELVAFVKSAIETWPERLAMFEPDADIALRTLLAVVMSFCFLYLLNRAPKGRDLEIITKGGTRKSETLANAKRLATYHGRLFERTDGQGAAVAYRSGIYLPTGLCQLLDRLLERHAAEKIAFVIVHEAAHARSLDNVLWALGTTNSLVIIGIVGVLLGQAVSLAAMIIIPDVLVQSISHEAAFSIAGLLLAVALAVVGAAIAGVVANLTAAREYFADALAGAVIGRPYLPYVDTDQLARVGTIVEPWRLGAADADRRLHVREVFPRAGALAISGVALWAIVRAILMFGSGGYSWGQIVFDAAVVGCLCALLFLLPPRSEGARDYTRFPLVIALLAMGLLGGVPGAIDAFAARFDVSPPFPLPWLLNLTLPPLALLGVILVGLNLRKRHNPDLESIDRHQPRLVAIMPILFFLGAPAWAVSFILAGLCIFVLSNFGLNVLFGANRPETFSAANILSALILALLAVLLAKNLKRPSLISVMVEIVLSVTMLFGFYYISNIMYDVAATSGGVLRVDVVLARMMSFEQRDLPPLVTAFGVCVVLLISWVSRFRFKRWQVGVQ